MTTPRIPTGQKSDVGKGGHTEEEVAHRSTRELEIRTRIAEVFLTVPDDDMYYEVLKIVLETMDSAFGVFGYIDEQGDLIVPTMTRQIWDRCQVPDKNIIFPRETWGDSSWPRAIRQKRTIFSNTPSTNIPEGHIGIRRNAAMPIVHQGEVVGLIQVANKETDYEEHDIELLETIAGIIAPILDARLRRDRHENARRQAEDQLKQTLANLERSNRDLEQFAYVASHDLQEPLRMVSSYTQLLGRRYRDKLDEEANEFIAYAVNGANRMQQLINDLLSFSRVSTQGSIPGEKDAHAILGQALANLKAVIDENHAIITNDNLPVVRADESQLVQVFQNLVGNAVKFHDTEPPRVHVSVVREDDEWVFSVHDNGIGIEQAYKDRIFEIFEQLHGKDEYPGTGIGLALCKRIVERHGGRIWTESVPGEGSTFYFTIPV